MKIAFLLDNDDPQDNRKLQELSKNNELMIALWDINQLFRNTLKYEGFMEKGKYLTDEEYNVTEKMREKFIEILEEHDIKQMVLEMP